MKQIHLMRTDLPQNQELTLDTAESTREVVLGRGTTLACDDKRVSRNHCLLRILPDGGVLLVAIHSNPCFYKLQSQGPVSTLLSRNDSVKLYQGDEFSLLPESFCYRLSTRMEGSGESGSVALEPTNEMLETTLNYTAEEIDNRELDNMNETLPAIPSTSTNGVTPPKLVLPDWLTNLPQSTTIPPLSKARKRKIEQEDCRLDKKQKNSYNESCKANTNLQQQTATSPAMADDRVTNVSPLLQQETAESSEILGVLEPVTTEARVPTVPQVLQNTSDTDPHTPHHSPHSGNKEDYEESWRPGCLARVKTEPGINSQENTETAGDQAAEIRIPINIKRVKDEPVDNDSSATDLNQGASGSSTQPATGAAREMCIYGVACYRRNPQHRTDFSHPGDTDYDAAVEDLPECEYGTSCYRKNVQHRKDFKHTKKMSPPPPRPRPQQANNPVDPARLGNTSEEDEYDLNDSFLNDASSDDYQPSGSSGSEEDSEWQDDSQPDNVSPKKENKRKGRKPK